MQVNFKYVILFIFLLLISGCEQKKSQPEVTMTPETALPSVAKEQEETDVSGSCGTITWTLSEEGVLSVGGTGKIDGEELSDSIAGEASVFAEIDIKKIMIMDGITELGNYCFCDYFNLETVEMADSVRKLGRDAFSGCEKMKEIQLSPNISEIGNYVFGACTSLKKIVLPEKLEKYAKNAIEFCCALDEIENRSARAWKLTTKDVAGRWYVDGKEVDELPPGKTASIRSVTYQISYDLSGGEAKGELPTSYESREGGKIPKTVRRKGYSLINWYVENEEDGYERNGILEDTIQPGEEGNRKATAYWIKFQLKRMKNGKARAYIELDPFNEKDDYDFECAIRYSLNEDMSDYEVLMPYFDEYDNGGELKEMKKGRRYYVEYAVYGGGWDLDDMEEDETLDVLPWQGKQEFTCG